jgi:hypothetical protein
VGDVREFTITQNSADWIDGVIYTPYGPHAIRGSGADQPPAEMTLVIETGGDQVQIAGELKNTVASLNHDVPVSQIGPLKNWVAEAMAEPRSTSALFALFCLRRWRCCSAQWGFTASFRILSHSARGKSEFAWRWARDEKKCCCRWWGRARSWRWLESRWESRAG